MEAQLQKPGWKLVEYHAHLVNIQKRKRPIGSRSSIIRSTNNFIWQANLYNNLGILQHGRKNYVEATSSFEKAIHYAKIGGSPRLEAYTLTSIGDLYQELDAHQETFEAYRQAREIAQRIKIVICCII